MLLGSVKRSAQRHLSEATRDKLIIAGISKRKPRQKRGHLCEYEIHWPGVYKKLGIPPGGCNSPKKALRTGRTGSGSEAICDDGRSPPEAVFKIAIIKQE